VVCNEDRSIEVAEFLVARNDLIDARSLVGRRRLARGGMGLNTKARAKREGILPGMLERIRIALPQKQIRHVISGVEACKRRHSGAGS